MTRRHPAADPMRDELRPPPAYPGMRIGLLGGSFNPPHAGHTHIALIALNRLRLDRLWWLVTPGNPLKSRADRASFQKRLAAARAFARHPRMDVTGFEAACPDAYTVNTLRFLRRRHPGVRWVWVMGADNLASLHRWQGWRQILHLVPVAVVDRPDCRLRAWASRAAHAFRAAYVDEADAAGLALLAPPAWTFLTVRLVDVSSTALRRGLRQSGHGSTATAFGGGPGAVGGD